MKISQDNIYKQLEAITIPQYGKSIIDLGMIKDLQGDNHQISLTLSLPISLRHLKDSLPQKINAAIQERFYDIEVNINTEIQVEPQKPSAMQGIGLQNVKYSIAIASGKGGVGKSTVTANLARALAQSGYKVGVMDTDIYGPSMSMMLGTNQKPQVTENKKLLPVEINGIKLVSMDMFSQADSAVIWRGPMASQMVQNFLNQVLWGALDYLLIDLPPGTGDIHLTLTQSANLSGALVVTTPQEIALLDVRKGIQMFEKVSVPILGIVENMSYFICDSCDKKHSIFQQGGGSRVAQKYGIPLIAQIPINPQVCSAGDNGLETEAQSDISQVFLKLAQSLVTQLSELQTTEGLKSFNYNWSEIPQA